ncbi:hypothetical protein BHM03_00026645 [Ensete ventricosum]|nr:hypothetical protein BHM03_00026645 [Ensete ventricosum]
MGSPRFSAGGVSPGSLSNHQQRFGVGGTALASSTGKRGVCPATFVGPAHSPHWGWGLARRDPSDARKAPLVVLLEGGFIPMEEELVCTFRLTSIVTSGVAESYGEPTGVVVWDEDVGGAPSQDLNPSRNDGAYVAFWKVTQKYTIGISFGVIQGWRLIKGWKLESPSFPYSESLLRVRWLLRTCFEIESRVFRTESPVFGIEKLIESSEALKNLFRD